MSSRRRPTLSLSHLYWVFFSTTTTKNKQVAALPPLRPLALIAKAVLKEAGLNQVFTGGLSSYCTTLMVIAHLQEEAAEADAEAAKAAAAAAPSSSSSEYALHYHRLVDMGHLLLSFFRRFGKSFDYERQAVRVSKGGVRPKPAAWVLPDKPRYLLSVEDPQEQGKDIGSGTFNVMAVRECFSRAADALSAALQREQQQQQQQRPPGNAARRESDVFARGSAASGADAALTDAGLSAKMLMQVHDELVFEAPEAEAEKTIAVVRRIMEKAAEPAVALTVPLVVDARAAANWDEAH